MTQAGKIRTGSAAGRRGAAGQALQWLVSLGFVAQMYLVMALMAAIFTPWALADRRGAFAAIHSYCRWVRWSAAWMVGLRSEIRGTVPEGEVLVAAKHQSFFDIILICSVLPRPKFIMKKELRRAPILGWYARRIGCVPVDRWRKGAAVAPMLREVESGRAHPGQLVIYPQGTRVPVGETRPYKIGVGLIYDAMGQACVPAATNVGLFWPRRSILRKPGLAVVEFLPPIEPGLKVEAFMTRLAQSVETHSDRLVREAATDGEGGALSGPDRES